MSSRDDVDVGGLRQAQGLQLPVDDVLDDQPLLQQVPGDDARMMTQASEVTR